MAVVHLSHNDTHGACQTRYGADSEKSRATSDVTCIRCRQSQRFASRQRQEREDAWWEKTAPTQG